jgi:phage tail-like protein
MEALTEPAEQILMQIHSNINPYNTPDTFLPFLACWVDLDRFFPAFQQAGEVTGFESGRLRELILASAQLSKLRGTKSGLKQFLEIATGQQGFVIEENLRLPNNETLPFHIQVNAPATAMKHQALIERIIEQEKPAYVTHTLQFNILNNKENEHGQDS